MGIGFALGGIAKGFSDQQQLALQNKQLQDNQAYRNAMLGLEQQRLKATTGLEAATQARTVYDNLLSNVKDVINAGLKAGKPVEAITAAIQPQVAYMQKLAPLAGIDVSAAAGQVTSLLNSGVQKTPTSTTDVLGPILDKYSKGQALSKTEKALLDNYFKQQSPFAGLMQGATQGTDLSAPSPSSLVPDAEAAPAGGAPATTVPPTAPAATKSPPPIPQGLVGKQPHWSPSDPNFFFLPDGTVTDLQGRPLGKINAAAQ